MYKEFDYNLKQSEWIDWKYRKNPYGEPILVIAESNGKIAGMQALIPRLYYSNNNPIQTVEAVDAFVRPSFRRDGIYQHIWIKTLQIVKARNLVLTTFPSTKSQSIGAMRKEGLKTLGALNTYLNILRPAALLERKNLHRLSWVYKNVFEPFHRVNRTPDNLSVDVLEITEFQRSEQPENMMIVGGRSQEYLNWKFCDSPMNDYTSVLFSEASENIGFAAFRIASDKATLTVHDYVINSNLSGCIDSLKKHIWDNYPEIGAILFTELESGPLASTLKNSGFFVKPSNQVLMLDNIDESVLPLDPEQWLITRGDSDW